MRTKSRLFFTLLRFVALLCGAYSHAFAQTYGFNTLAGEVSKSGILNGVGTAAQFYFPEGVAADGRGNVFVSDRNNHAIRKIDAVGFVTTFAGNPGSAGSVDGVGSTARFTSPRGLAVDASGNVFVADYENRIIRKITPDGIVRTLAGSASGSGSVDGAGSVARFRGPNRIALDQDGSLFVSDTDNHTIRKITAEGVVTTIAGVARSGGSDDGLGSAARFVFPYGIAVDGSRNLFIADTGNHTIRKMSASGVVTTFAGAVGSRGSVDGTASVARFNNPSDVIVDASGNLFVSDTGNNTIRKIAPDGIVTTVAGTAGSRGSSNGVGSAARFFSPSGLTFDGIGSLLVADTQNNTIRRGLPLAAVGASRLVNLSILTSLVGVGDIVTIGVVIGGAGTSGGKPLLVRAAGPALASFGLTGLLDDPALEFLPDRRRSTKATIGGAT